MARTRGYLWCAPLEPDRSDAASWPDLLARLRSAGFTALVVAVPWRFHALPSGGFDFAGATDPRRGLTRLLQLSQETGLACIVRAGPWLGPDRAFGALPDDASPDVDPRVAPDRSLAGHPVRWRDLAGTRGPVVPDPLDPAYLGRAAAWLRALAAEALQPAASPEGPLVAVEVDPGCGHGPLLSDSGHGAASQRAWADFVHTRRGPAAPAGPMPGKAPEAPATRRELLPLLDRAAFAGAAHRLAYEHHVQALREGGLPPGIPVLAAQPQPDGAPRFPGLRDVWLARCAAAPGMAWSRGAAPDPAGSLHACVDALLASGRGPAPRLGPVPTLAAAALELGLGATALTGAPGPLAALLGPYLAAEGPGVASATRAASLGWAVYAPHAWAGAWAPRGRRDHKPWLDGGFRRCPSVAHHGVEALAEGALHTGVAWDQVDLLGASPEALAQRPMLVVPGHDAMAPAAQERLVAYVRDGGHVLLTGVVPRWDDDLERAAMPLREALFPHPEEDVVRLRRAVPVDLAGGPRTLAADWAVRVTPPPGAEAVAWVGADPVGYRREVGAGSAIYLGFSPWHAALAGDDVHLAEAQRGVPAWALGLAGLRARWAWADHEGLLVVQRSAPDDVQHLAVLSRAAVPVEAAVQFTRASGARDALRLAVLPGTGALVSLRDGAPRSLVLQGLAEQSALAAPPRLEAQGRRWSADAPCDLSVACHPSGLLEVRVVGAAGEVEVALGVPATLVDRVTTEAGQAVAARTGVDGGLRFPARDAAEAGAYRVHVRPGDHPWWSGREAGQVLA